MACPSGGGGPELEAALGEFEAALRQAELSENTVQTYVGRSQTFVRWLMGDDVPHGPNKPSGHAVHTHVATLGQNLLDAQVRRRS